MEKQTFITLEDIDTSIAAENFNRLLDENKTYFLNGSWGSGKTTFLESTESQSKKKFVTIDLWRNTDKRSLVEVAYAGLHPVLYWGALLFSFLFVIISILMTNTVNLGLSKFLHPIWILPVGFISLVVAAVQLVAIKTEIVYSWLLANLCLKNKVLVIDDFDRLTPSQQEEAYRLFSLLRGRLPIVFVGDIENIYSVKDNFLSKIIDRRVELPFVLQSEQIWDDYFIKLEQRFATEISDSFKKRVKVEKRSLRDREHFNDYVNQEFFSRGKLGHVQVEEQLLVIYSYLFIIEYYRKLLNNETIIENKSNSSDFSEIFTKGEEIPNLLSRLQRDNTNKYPVSFKMNREGYFLYESPPNRTSAELYNLFSDSELTQQLQKELTESETKSDFYQYLRAEYRGMEYSNQRRVATLAIELSLKDVCSRSLDYIIKEWVQKIVVEWGVSWDNYDEMEERLSTCNLGLSELELDISAILFILEKHRISSFTELGEIFYYLEISDDIFSNVRKKVAYLFTYFSSKDIHREFEVWEEPIWSAIGQLSTEEFLQFWEYQGILSHYDKSQKEYVIWKRRCIANQIEDYTTTVINKIQPRIDLLKSKGYSFSTADEGQIA
ncbi:TPA: NTPase [Streptococcus suis]|nr:NTPase [Streptococcus suis]